MVNDNLAVTKQCTKCKQYLPIAKFNKHSRKKDGLCSKCKNCRKQYRQLHKEQIAKRVKQYYQLNKKEIHQKNKLYRENHKQECAEYMKQYQQEHKDKISKQFKQYRQEHKNEIEEHKKQYYQKHKTKIVKKQKQYYQKHKAETTKRNREYLRKRRQTDIKFNLSQRISRAILHSLKQNKTGRRWESLVGYNVSQLKRHLKRTMPASYTWQDYLDGKLHIDHIIPKSIFNYKKPTDIDFQRCWALSNLQLLPARENIIKSNKLIKPFQRAISFGIIDNEA